MNDYSVGTFLLKENEKRLEIVEVEDTYLVLKDPFIGDSEKVARRVIDEKVFLGQMSIASYDERSQSLKKNLSKDFASFSDDEKQVALRRYAYVKGILDANLSGFTKRNMEAVLKHIADDRGDIAPNWRTVVRWIKWYESSEITGLMDQNSRKGNRSARVSPETEELIETSLKYLLKKERPTIAKAYEYFKTEVSLKNANRPKEEKLKLISYQAFNRKAKKFSEYDKLLHHVGKQKAAKRYRQSHQSALAHTVDHILDCVEIDHTVVDLFVVDDTYRIPLGKPRITCIIDWKSKSILGFYIGFEDPSFISIAKAMKMAISDKSKLLEDCPLIENGHWPCRGVFKSISYDRGRDFESSFLRDALLELQISGNANPAGKPWNKGSIESFFNTLNKKFLVDIPGKVFSNFASSNEYRSEKNAVLSLSELRDYFLKWIVEIYQVTPNSTETRIPNETWLEDEQFVGIRMVDEHKLDLMLCENKTRTIGQRGITNEGLIYYSDQLLKLSMKGIRKVQIKVNRDDLGYIYVLDESKGEYFRVEASNQEISKGISVKQHEMAKRYVREQIRAKVDEESIARAWNEIQLSIEQSVSKTKSVTRRLKQAQMMGAGKTGKPATLLQDKSREKRKKSETVDSLLKQQVTISKLPKDMES